MFFNIMIDEYNTCSTHYLFLLPIQLRINSAQINIYCFRSQNILLYWHSSLGPQLICGLYQIGHITLLG